jgi:hypothetical protein
VTEHGQTQAPVRMTGLSKIRGFFGHRDGLEKVRSTVLVLEPIMQCHGQLGEAPGPVRMPAGDTRRPLPQLSDLVILRHCADLPPPAARRHCTTSTG